QHLGRHVRDRGRALARAVQLGRAADLEDVGVARDREVAGALVQERQLELLEEGDRALAAQHREGGLALRPRETPEHDVGEIYRIGSVADGYLDGTGKGVV